MAIHNSRLAVCSWSLQPGTPEDLFARLQDTGITQVQLALDPLRDQPAFWGHSPALFAKHGISLVSGMFGCVGEDYSTLESIKATGGVAPDATWEHNLKNAKASALLAKTLGLKLLTFHAGFIPYNRKDPGYGKIIDRVKQIVDVFAAEHMQVAMETGQETADDLAAVLRQLDRPNLGVNFDPANMILYDKGNPIEALKALGPWIRQVHIKDAIRTKFPGTWGEEVRAGTGQVDWTAFFSELKRLNFQGHYVIEREAGSQRVADIRTAKALVEGALN